MNKELDITRVSPEDFMTVLRKHHERIKFVVFDTETMGHTQRFFAEGILKICPYITDFSVDGLLTWYNAQQFKQPKFHKKTGALLKTTTKAWTKQGIEFKEFIEAWLQRHSKPVPTTLGVTALKAATSVFQGTVKEALHPHLARVYSVQVGAYVPEAHRLFLTEQSGETETLRELVTAVYQNSRLLIMQNADFDIRHVYSAYGLLPEKTTVIHDTQQIESLYVAGSDATRDVSLKGLCDYYQLPDQYRKVSLDPTGQYWINPSPEAVKYGLMDVVATSLVYLEQRNNPEWIGLQPTLLLESSIRRTMAKASVQGVELNKDLAVQYYQKVSMQKSESHALVFESARALGIVPEGSAINEWDDTRLNSQEFATLILSTMNTAHGIIKANQFDSLEKKKLFTHQCYPLLTQEWKTFLKDFMRFKSRLKQVSDMRKTVIPVLSSEHPTGRVHPVYGSVAPPKAPDDGAAKGAISGRFTTRGFNVLNRSEVEKQYVVAQEGHRIVTMDYSGIEVRVAASLSHETALLDIFKNGGDPYRVLGGKAFNVAPETLGKTSKERKLGKEGVLAFTFDALPYTLATQVKNRSLGETIIPMEEAEALHASWWELCPIMYVHKEVVKATAFINGFAITPLGRKRKFNWGKHRQALADRADKGWYVRRVAEVVDANGVKHVDPLTISRASCPVFKNVPINHAVQGAAAEGFKYAISKLPLEETDTNLIATPHDAVDLDVTHTENFIDKLDSFAYTLLKGMQSILQRAGGSPVVLEVEGCVGKCWAKYDASKEVDYLVPNEPGYYQAPYAVWKLDGTVFTKTLIEGN